jgi:hypothetical protein
MDSLSARVRPEITFPGSDLRKFLILGCLLVLLRSLKLFGNISKRSATVARGALLIGSAGQNRQSFQS